jgi:glycosyltransferase involved in cell wall biosynthesis
MDAARGNGAGRDAAAGHTVVVIPTLDEEQSIAEVVRSIPRTIASRVIVADGGSCDATVARAKAAGVDGIDGRTKKSKSNGLSDVAATLSNSSSLVPPENHIRAYL